MKRVLKKGLLMVVVLPLLFMSCKKDLLDTPGEQWVVSMATIVGNQASYDLQLDDETFCSVVTNYVSSFPVENEERVLANFTIVDRNDTGYEVRLNALERVIQKLPIYASGYSDEELEALGHNPFHISRVWLTGGKYLNFYADFFNPEPDLKNTLNLLVKDESSTDQKVVLELRYKANEKENSTTSYTEKVLTFDVEALMPAGKDEINLEIYWVDYRNGDQNKLLLFKSTQEN